MVQIGRGMAAEAVDITVRDGVAVLCGGFGANVSDVSKPSVPRFIGVAGERCQHGAFGPRTERGQILYLTHHGDSWVSTPSLSTWLVTANAIEVLDTIEDPNRLWEGPAWQAGFLYVAAHQGGLLTYRTSGDGLPRLVHTLGGFKNAWKVEVAGPVAYVVDNDDGVYVIDLRNPEAPAVSQLVETTGKPRDLAIGDGRVYVALGGSGVDVFDIAADGLDLGKVNNIDTLGSAQSVSVAEGVLAVAAWTHVATYDARTLMLLATETTRGFPEFEQNLGVSSVGKHVFVAEWEFLFTLEHRPGLVAPDMWVDAQQYQFPRDEARARAIIVRNVGRLPVEIDAISAGDAAFALDKTKLSIPPREAAAVELTYSPTAGKEQSLLEISSNDPDPEQASWQGGLLVSSDAGLDVGDRLDDAFAFLDPNGQNQVAGLQGKVIVLSYFALF
ncbi:MAG: hypothetical protein SF187_02220 [Deltaproteobacteria bacterium]|nr:hypothetical protein [Deltaproteobacteria bacterium]